MDVQQIKVYTFIIATLLAVILYKRKTYSI